MNPHALGPPSSKRLRQIIHTMLCDFEQLDAAQFPLSERNLTRAGKLCGILFSVQGPRQMKLTAVWDFLKNEIYFYDSSGTRCLQMPVAELNSSVTTAVLCHP